VVREGVQPLENCIKSRRELLSRLTRKGVFSLFPR